VKWILVFLVLAVMISLCSCGGRQGRAGIPTPPESPKKPVTDEYHGVKVTEDYRWLEDFTDPEVKRWIEEQNRYSRVYLDKILSRSAIFDRLKELHNRSASYYALKQRGNLLFGMKDQPPKNHPMLVVMRSASDPKSERVLVDPDAINPKVPTAVDWYAPSLDGKLVAVSLSENGSEDGTVYVFETATGKKLPDIVPRAQYATAGGDVAWNRNATGFYYTRYPQGNERPEADRNFYQQVYFHKLGTPSSKDTYVIGKEFPRIAEIELRTTAEGSYMLASVANGDGGEHAHFLMDSRGKWTQVTRFSDKVTSAVLGRDGKLYLLSRNDVPRGKILGLPLKNPRLSEAKTVVHSTGPVIDFFSVTGDRFYVVDVIGGPNQIRIFDLSGKAQGTIPIRPISAVGEIVPLENDEILYSNQTYVDPVAYYCFDPATGKSTKTGLAVTTPADLRDTEVVREFATSRDGTKVPMNIIRRRGIKLDGQSPVLLTGYGGFAISQRPSFSDRRCLWIEQNGVYVVANLRGGDEYGEEWHAAGNLTRKQNVFDDFVACARYLIENGYTNPSRLAIEGGSNGGLLMGASLTQHPEMFRAVVSEVGIYDMLRVELSPNGQFNVTEYGTVKNPEQFRALYAYSPYHNVKDGTAYPAVLMTTGDNDARVAPLQSRKMTARLQAATSSKLPVLLRTDPHAGHGIGTSLDQRVAEETDVYAFLFDQLGMRYRSVRR
jgi:prolyl oligopeptidase